MARPKTIQLSILNIVTHPHSPERYYSLFKRVFTQRIIQKVRGSDYGMVGSFRENYYEKYGLIFGDLFKFVSIDPNQKYLDLETLKTIDPAETGETFPVPENLKPNLKNIGYVFSTKKHRLFFESSEISPGSILTLMKKLFSVPHIQKEFGEVDCTIEQTGEAIKKILAIPKLTKLVIDFKRPNPDDLPDYIHSRIIKRLEKQKIRRHDQTLRTDDAEGMKPDEETLAWMDLAKSNGKVYAVGYDGDERVEQSTIKHPVKEKITYDPDIELKSETMVGFSLDLIKNKLNK